MLLLLLPPLAAGAPPVRNVLYIVFDDLRPELSAYGRQHMVTPNIQKLADSGLVFERAYAQEAVCSPSRNSFSTGRRPNSTQVWNFINHFRQAECKTTNLARSVGTPMAGGFNTTAGWKTTNTGGVAQCCTSCTAAARCAGWSYVNHTCTLLSAVSRSEPCPTDRDETYDSCVSGESGTFPRWTPLPANFRQHGYLTLGVGKYYHDGGGGLGGAPGDVTHPRGQGTPPLADRAESWSDVPVQWPNQTEYSERWGHVPCAYGNFEYLVPDDEQCGASGGPSTDFCAPDGFDMDGAPPVPPKEGVQPLCDFVTYNDAIRKLRHAADNVARRRQPFFLVAGIKRPHLNWRTPPGYAAMYPPSNVTLPTKRTLDRSVWAGAYTVFPMDAAHSGDFVTSPYASGDDEQLRALRRHYYAAVSWADRATGKVLDELDALGLRGTTMVVLHADHGWHLGEYAMWEKRTNWELGVRVPLIMRVPWLPAASGARTRALVELVDVYPTGAM